MLARLASISLLLFAAAASAEDSVDARAARYYAVGLERPLSKLRMGVQLTAACTGRLRRSCSKQQREFAAKDRTLALLDSLSLFAALPGTDPAAGIRRADELKARMATTSADLLSAAGEYDAVLFARYGAALEVCPDPDVDAAAYRASIDELIRIELTGFRALGAPEAASAKESIALVQTSQAAALRAQPADECVAIQKLGWHLMELMNSKLKPWNSEDPGDAAGEPAFAFGAPIKPAVVKPPGNELGPTIAGNFVLEVATELELRAHPESEAVIKPIVDEFERANGRR